jgi:hypothetical protein
MAKAIHLINRRVGASLHGMTKWLEEPGGFRSCCWRIGDEQAAELIGGWVYFHDTKAKPASYGGLILGFEPGEGDMTERKVILFRGDVRSRGERWRGADHGMAMCGASSTPISRMKPNRASRAW